MDRLRHRAEVAPAHRLGTRAADLIDAARGSGRPVVVVHGGAVEMAGILLELEQRGAEPILPAGPVELVHAGGGPKAITAAAARVTSHAEGTPVLLVVHPLGLDNPAGRSPLDCAFAQDTPFDAETSICLFDVAHAAAGGLQTLLRHTELRFDGIRGSTETADGRLLVADLLLELLDSRVAVRRLAMSPSLSDLERPALERLVARRLRALERPGPRSVVAEPRTDGSCSATCSICEAVITTDGDVTALLDLARPHIGHTLLLEDTSFHAVAWSPEGEPPPSLTELITPGRLAKLTGQLVTGVPEMVRLGTPAAGHRWVARVGSGESLGYLSAAQGPSHPDLTTVWWRHISTPLASELARRAGRRRLHLETRHHLVTVLVRGELSRASAQLAINDLVGALGVRVAALAPAARTMTPPSATASPGPAPDAVARRLDTLGVPYGEYDGLTVALIDGSEGGPAALVAALSPHQMTIGLGSTVTDPADISSSARQAAWTCRMAVSTRRPILDFAGIGVHRLLLPGAEAGDPEFEEPIHRLERAQSELGFDTVGTLVGYLDAGGNYRRAARDLTIHVNTLRYRLKRISSIIDADLDDPEQRFRLKLAARLRAGRQALQESGAD